MSTRSLSEIGAHARANRRIRPVGRVARAARGLLTLQGLERRAALGDGIEIETAAGSMRGEIVDLSDAAVIALADGSGDGVRLGDPATLLGEPTIAPDDSWLGRIVDAYGRPLDGRPLRPGARERALHASAPVATRRRPMGARLSTGFAVFDTLLPIARGQRLGLFSGSGVGKSTLLADLADGVEADVVVLALVGERGREVRDFARRILSGPGGRRAVLVVATSDQPPLSRRRALWSAMAISEHFRDRGDHVLLLADSVTRFAEAHREVALAAGERAELRGHPPSMLHQVTAIAERAGPGPEGGEGDITALMTVLVAGSDMEEPVADTLRGVLDGHVVLDRSIAERGRFPAVDVLRSVSRSLPAVADAAENAVLHRVRRLLGAHDRAEIMVQSGLYTSGSDPELDAAISAWPRIEAFLGERVPPEAEQAFQRLAQCVGRLPS